MRSTWIALLLIPAVAGAGVALSWVPRDPDALRGGLSALPPETVNAHVTDWVGLRESLRAEDMSSAAPRGAVRGFLDSAYDADLSAVSLLAYSAPAMAEHYGWSVLDAHWESFGQSTRGAAGVVQLPEDFDMREVRRGLADLGYAEPEEGRGVWRGGPDTVARIDSALTPMLSYVVVLDDSHRVVVSDRAPYAARTARVAAGELESFGDAGGVAAVAANLDGALAAVLHPGRRGCRHLGFAGASRSDRLSAAERIAAAGGLHRYRVVGMGLVDGTAGPRDLRVAMHFDRRVVGEADRRAVLATGEAPAQGGTFESRFRVLSARQRVGDVVLTLRPRGPDGKLLSDFTAGRVLFASCGATP